MQHPWIQPWNVIQNGFNRKNWPKTYVSCIRHTSFIKYHVSDIPHLNLANVPAHLEISNFRNVNLVANSYSKCFGIFRVSKTETTFHIVFMATGKFYHTVH